METWNLDDKEERKILGRRKINIILLSSEHYYLWWRSISSWVQGAIAYLGILNINHNYREQGYECYFSLCCKRKGLSAKAAIYRIRHVQRQKGNLELGWQRGTKFLTLKKDNTLLPTSEHCYLQRKINISLSPRAPLTILELKYPQ